jgi:hypothetical protein
MYIIPPFIPLTSHIGQGIAGEAFDSQQFGLVLKVGSRVDGSLQHEAQIYRKLDFCLCVPKIYGHYYSDSFDVLLLENCGVPLSGSMWVSERE